MAPASPLPVDLVTTSLFVDVERTSLGRGEAGDVELARADELWARLCARYVEKLPIQASCFRLDTLMTPGAAVDSLTSRSGSLARDAAVRTVCGAVCALAKVAFGKEALADLRPLGSRAAAQGKVTRTYGKMMGDPTSRFAFVDRSPAGLDERVTPVLP